MERALLHAILLTKNGTFGREMSNNTIDRQKKMYLYVCIYIYNTCKIENSFYCPLLMILFSPEPRSLAWSFPPAIHCWVARFNLTTT